MEHAGAYGSLIVPGVLVLVLLYAVLKVVGAIFKIFFLVGLIAVLGGGSLLYGRINAIQQATSTAGNQGPVRIEQRAALGTAVAQTAASAARAAGLNPNDVHTTLSTCDGPNTHLTVRYTDDKFLFGMLNRQEFSVPVSAGC